jgi:5-oxopent-3-ene-1,2,5-tricarboxylate decarboxylase / 2-hydroxyhepta-2,4-diene-1,7-dioate isomerase
MSTTRPPEGARTAARQAGAYSMTTAPVTSAGTVYGVLLNSKDEWAAWAPQMAEPPYKAPPKAPVLYVKTVNTWSACGNAICLPYRAPKVEIGASLAMVIGTAAQHVTAAEALAHVAGYVLVNDLSLPHASFYRPPVKYKNLDGFLGIGPKLATPAEVGDPAGVRLEVRIDGILAQTVDCARMLRPAARLIADVSEFMTLHRGDVLLLGLGVNRPLAHEGQRVDIHAPGIPALGTLSNPLIAEAA